MTGQLCYIGTRATAKMFITVPWSLSRNVMFGPTYSTEHKDFQFTVIEDKENQQIFTFEAI